MDTSLLATAASNELQVLYQENWLGPVETLIDIHNLFVIIGLSMISAPAKSGAV
jgi:hypothetical protein